ncbi:MAG: hypothetical protein RI894_220, partial [Bacteroidota bacterium]
WVGGPVDGLHPASATWTYLKNTFLFNRVTLGQLINIKSDTPVGGGVLCQPCIATPATFSYTLNEQTKKVPSIGYGTAANTLNPASGLVSDNNCVQVSATLQW